MVNWVEIQVKEENIRNQEKVVESSNKEDAPTNEIHDINQNL